MSSPSRLPLIASLAVLVVGIAGFAVATWRLTPQPAGQQAASGQKAALGGPFQLIDQTGAAVSEQAFLGKPTLLFFGFTHCPDICPTKLYELTQLLDAMGPDAARVNTVFVSVDPSRDTPALMKDYLASFHASIRGFTGSEEQVANMIRIWRVYARKVPLEKGDYTMDHTAGIYLLDKKGEFVRILDITKGIDEARNQLKPLL